MLALVNWEVHFIPPQAVHFKDMRLELSGESCSGDGFR